MAKTKLEKQAIAIAKSQNGQLGKLPLETVLKRHIGFFTDLRASGASWPQITGLMAKAGITRQDGHPLTADQWRAVFSRVAKVKKPVNSGEIAKSTTAVKEFVKYEDRKDILNTNTDRTVNKDIKGVRDRIKGVRDRINAVKHQRG
jgi:hypothetical protein